jgi:uncharacterized protein YjbJ (UPF0337 family)
MVWTPAKALVGRAKLGLQNVSCGRSDWWVNCQSHVQKEGHEMKVSTKDTIKGVAREAKGEVEQTIGSVINRPDIKAKGKKDRAAGRVQRQADDRKQIG